MSEQLPELFEQGVVNVAHLRQQVMEAGVETVFSAQELAEMKEGAELVSASLADVKW